MERLTGAIQNYAWGSTTAIPEILGRAPDGRPQAELWLGAHPAAPSLLGTTALPDLITAEPEILGAESLGAFGPRLSFLMKILAADRALSLQAHPSREQAQRGWSREEAAGIPRDAVDRNYVDDWPKPEALCALGDVEALYGFADPARTAAHLTALQVPGLDALIAPLTTVGGAQGLAAVFVACCQLTGAQRHLVDEVVAAAAPYAGGADDLAQLCRTAIELAASHPGDPGVLAALLMNRIALVRHEALFLPAGNMHAYLHGTGVEIMANSNNVLRGGLTPKHVDVAELAQVVDFSPVHPPTVPVVEEAPGTWRYETPAPEFALWRLDLDGTDRAVPVPGHGRARIAVVTDGHATGGALTLSRGGSAWLSARDHAVLSGAGHVFIGACGLGPAPAG